MTLDRRDKSLVSAGDEETRIPVIRLEALLSVSLLGSRIHSFHHTPAIRTWHPNSPAQNISTSSPRKAPRSSQSRRHTQETKSRPLTTTRGATSKSNYATRSRTADTPSSANSGTFMFFSSAGRDCRPWHTCHLSKSPPSRHSQVLTTSHDQLGSLFHRLACQGPPVSVSLFAPPRRRPCRLAQQPAKFSSPPIASATGATIIPVVVHRTARPVLHPTVLSMSCVGCAGHGHRQDGCRGRVARRASTGALAVVPSAVPLVPASPRGTGHVAMVVASEEKLRMSRDIRRTQSAP